MTRVHAGWVLAGGAALGLAFPEADFGPLAWIAVAPLLLAVTGETSSRVAAGYGMLFGITFFGVLLAWLSIVGYLAFVLVIILESTFMALYATLYRSFAHAARGSAGRIIAAPVLWVAIEFLRAHVPAGGFVWGQLAQSQHEVGWMLRPAALGGGWLVAFIVIAINALVAESLRRRNWRAACGALALVVLPVLVPQNSSGGKPLRVAIVQGNVPRDFAGSSFDKHIEITRSHSELTQQLDPDAVDLVVWPESAMNLDFRQVPEVELLLLDAARAVGRPMIVGGNLEAPGDRYRVMAFQVSPEGEVIDSYQKTHLVPFGEYVPARGAIGWIPMLDQVPRDAVAGKERTIFDVAGGSVAPVISFEGDFGSLVRERIAEGGRMLVVATNTSTWGESWASAQHVAFSRVRAVENGVWVVHAAISGISAVIAPDGRVTGSLPLWTAGTLVRNVSFADSITPYARIGDWVPWGCIIGVAALAVLAVRRR